MCIRDSLYSDPADVCRRTSAAYGAVERAGMGRGPFMRLVHAGSRYAAQDRPQAVGSGRGD